MYPPDTNQNGTGDCDSGMEIADLRPAKPWEITIDPHALVSTVTEARLACVLDTTVDCIVVLDESGSILVFNKAHWRELCGRCCRR
jgi:hypothetical protein